MTLARNIEWQSYHIPDDEKSDKEKLLDEIEGEDFEDEREREETYKAVESMPVFMETAVGPMIKDDSMNPLRQIEHRICHTNFTIGDKEATRTNFIEGVETMTVLSRYQMIIGFGRMFDATAVRAEIKEKLLNMDTYSEKEYTRHKKILDKME